MRYSKWLKLGAVGMALLLIPRRSSRVASDKPNHMGDLDSHCKDDIKQRHIGKNANNLSASINNDTHPDTKSE